MATFVAETCMWLPCNKVTFIHRSAFVCPLKKIILPDNVSYPDSLSISSVTGLRILKGIDCGGYGTK